MLDLTMKITIILCAVLLLSGCKTTDNGTVTLPIVPAAR